jgi:hypothetical protein
MPHLTIILIDNLSVFPLFHLHASQPGRGVRKIQCRGEILRNSGPMSGLQKPCLHPFSIRLAAT